MTPLLVEEQDLAISELGEIGALEPTQKGTYDQILKSSALVGGASVLNIVIGIVRMKMMALLLGPAGLGLLSLYSSIVMLTQTFAGMGVNSSGVRQIAAATGSHKEERIALTTVVLLRTSIMLGLFGALILVLFSKQISMVTFGTREHASAVSVLAIAVFLTLIGAGQSALLQGLRRITDLAKTSVIGAFLGTLLSLPVVYFLRDRGVIPSLVGVAAMTALASWWYSRKASIKAPDLSFQAITSEAAALLKLGVAFMSSGLMTMGVAYVVRITVLRKIGFEATGLYQSAWTLGGLYVGFILQAMGADFYPRLTAHVDDDVTSNRLVNEQTQVGMLLAGPGVMATLTFAPLVISLFYSARFAPAIGILRWICLGTIIQVVTWPMGFIIVAKARQALFIGCEVAWALVSLSLAWLCIDRFGLTGAGIAFFGSYVFHGFLIYAVVNRLNGFHWSRENRLVGAVFLLVIAVVFCGFYVLPSMAAGLLGVIATIAGGAYSIQTLASLVSLDRIPAPVKRILTVLRLVRTPVAAS
jgi:enterobacterial common antigen flippase